jgi:hypothetical protein
MPLCNGTQRLQSPKMALRTRVREALWDGTHCETAQAHKHSLSQQALADLEDIPCGDPRERRCQVLDRIARRGPIEPSPTVIHNGELALEDLMRAERERRWPAPVAWMPRLPCA